MNISILIRLRKSFNRNVCVWLIYYPIITQPKDIYTNIQMLDSRLYSEHLTLVHIVQKGIIIHSPRCFSHNSHYLTRCYAFHRRMRLMNKKKKKNGKSIKIYCFAVKYLNQTISKTQTEIDLHLFGVQLHRSCPLSTIERFYFIFIRNWLPSKNDLWKSLFH